ncbi:hypothetical protein CP533_5577 [Ophiocordyceps camponoti-saundersi (nom. inval.)]|nr:hypothetical protein CP533_5577 [Ophiocordyceps camponoti-saundersi (nom. inval.)]
MVKRVAPRSRADVEEDADVGVESLAEGTKDDLTRHDSLLCAFKAQVGIERDLRRILVDVRLYRPVVDVVLGDAVLIDAHGGQSVQSAGVDLVSSTTIFCQPASPQVRDLEREQKWAIFFITACIVRVKQISSSLYMVTQMNSSVSRVVRPILCRSL